MNINLVVASLALVLFSSPAFSAKKMSADAILDQVEARLKSKDEVAHVDMEITEKNGKSKNRKLTIKKKNTGKKQQVLVRLEKPADIRGIGLLTVSDNGREDQWLYLPSKKKSRKIISSKKKDSFLGSEFSYEDFSPAMYKKFDNKVKNTTKFKGKDAYVILSSGGEGESSYGKIMTWVSKKDYQVLKSEYYDASGKKLKVMNFEKYKKFGKKMWRAQKILVKNVQNKRGTTLSLSKLKLNSGLGDSEFSKRALEKF